MQSMPTKAVVNKGFKGDEMVVSLLSQEVVYIFKAVNLNFEFQLIDKL